MFPGGARAAARRRLTAGAPAASGHAARRGAGRLDASSPPAAPFALGASGQRGDASRSRSGRPPRGTRAAGAPARCASSPRSAAAGASRAAWCASSTPTSRSRRCSPTPTVRAGARRARDRRRARIGYIPGPGDEVPGQPAPRRLRRHAARRRGAGRRRAALARFDAIVVGVRAFNTSERLRAAHAALMAYVEAGGTLVVQYNTNNRLAPLDGAARPLAVRHRRRSASPTRPRDGRPSLTPKHPRADARPTAIGAARLRGLGAGARPLLRRQVGPALRDAARDARPRRAAAARAACCGRATARATFVYTGLAFFRQLPAGVPGRVPPVREPARRRAAGR